MCPTPSTTTTGNSTPVLTFMDMIWMASAAGLYSPDIDAVADHVNALRRIQG